MKGPVVNTTVRLVCGLNDAFFCESSSEFLVHVVKLVVLQMYSFRQRIC